MKRATATHAARPRAAMPGLPPDLLRRISAGLRSPKPERKQAAIAALLAARAFAAGFARGADPLGSTRRHIVDADHEHWRAGHAAGLLAAADAAARYLRDRLPPASSAHDASTLAPTV